ncbi:MAG TPA: GC-type dockerin domain-anchored protein [Phycisphaerales bacterium]|nr:GC-type dockerin domain-anchored protein [Phycisphaerales bacterium]
MTNLLYRAFLTSCAASIPTLCFAQPSITFFTRPSCYDIRISDMSADGLTVVGSAYWHNAGGPGGTDFEVWKWTAAEGLSHLGYREMGGDVDNPVHISAHGEQVVFNGIIDGTSHAIRLPLNPAGNPVALPQPGGSGRNARPYEMSADGRVIVGEAEYPAAGGNTLHRATWWYLNGVGGNLGTLGQPFGVGSKASAVNANGTVIAGETGSAVGTQAFRWTSATGMQGLGQLSPGLESRSVAITADGEAVFGNALVPVPDGSGQVGSRAFKWTSAGGIQPLQLPAYRPNGNSPGLICCNADGSIAAGIGASADDGGSEAVVWHSRLGPINLDTYLPLHGLDLQGRQLRSVIRVSDDGRTFAGQATHGTVRETFVLRYDFVSPCGPADMAGQAAEPGGDALLDNNDFIGFIAWFFQNNMLTDLGHTGGLIGPDGRLDNNDFIAFVDLFFAGCD